VLTPLTGGGNYLTRRTSEFYAAGGRGRLMEMTDLGRTALVTGAAAGIGLEIATSFMTAGISVVLLDRSPEVVEVADTLTGRFSVPAIGLIADLSLESQVLAAAGSVLRTHGGVDILVNNAGIHPKHDGGPMNIEHSSTEVWNQILAVNLTAVFLLCRELLPAMRSRGWGRIVNMSSRAGRIASPLASTGYAATKAGLLGFSRKLATEVAADGITVNCVAPGPIYTAMSETSTKENRAAIQRLVPVGRYGTTSEVASAVAFLVSDAASYMTGAILDVNGGSYMP
jgi:3-oxoacyl-[acyl-carrier protein] reductase